jgi:hypothetical protein
MQTVRNLKVLPNKSQAGLLLEIIPKDKSLTKYVHGAEILRN